MLCHAEASKRLTVMKCALSSQVLVGLSMGPGSTGSAPTHNRQHLTLLVHTPPDSPRVGHLDNTRVHRSLDGGFALQRSKGAHPHLWGHLQQGIGASAYQGYTKAALEGMHTSCF